MKERAQGFARFHLFFILLLFGVFTLCLLTTVVFGSKTYQRILHMDEGSGDAKTALNYVATKLRGADEAGAIRVDTLGESDALVIRSEIDGELYETWIYYFNGALRELYTYENAGALLEDGTPVLSVSDFRVEKQENLLTVSAEGTDGAWFSSCIGLHE